MEPEIKKGLVIQYGYESSKDLPVEALTDLVQNLENKLKPQVAELDKLRKMVMASIGGWLELTNQETGSAIIKSIACRSTKHKSFNSIPKERLRNVYNNFLNKQKDFKEVKSLTREQIKALTYVN